MTPVNNILPDITPLTSGCNRSLKMSFEDQLNILVYFHLEEHRSGHHLLQVLKEEHFARQHIVPMGGIEKSSFFEGISSRGLDQMLELFEKLYAKTAKHLPKGHAELGDLTLIDGSLANVRLFCPCTRPTTGMVRKRPRFTSALISIAAFPRKFSSRTAKGRNGLSLPGFWRQGKRAS